MTNRSGKQPPRRLFCSGCGTEFTCGLSAFSSEVGIGSREENALKQSLDSCWCAEETARLPMPVAGEDCLCRDCLRKAAKAHA
jgi:hypothetical protein